MKKTQENIDKILQLIPTNGITNACIMADVSPTTFWLWRKEDKELDKKVRGCTHIRVQMVEDAIYKKAIGGDTTAMIFILTNRDPENWQDRRNIQHSGKLELGKIQVEFVNGSETQSDQSPKKDT